MSSAPAGVLDQIGEVPSLIWDPTGELDYIHIFVSETAELIDFLEQFTDRLAPKGMLWVSWPKKSAGFHAELDRETVREVVLTTGLVDIKVCAVDDTWSGLKFVHRRKK